MDEETRRAVEFYATFHERKPARIIKMKRPDWYCGPKALVCLGRVGEITYIPQEPSVKKGIEYVHAFGDYGPIQTSEKPLLVTDPDGQALHILKVGSRFKVDPERGIVG